MKDFKKNNFITISCGLIGIIIFTVSFFLIGTDVVLTGGSIFSSLVSNSFFLSLSVILLAYSIFTLRKNTPQTKNIVYSFVVSYIVLIIAFIALIFIASFIKDANLSEAPLFAVLFLPAVFLYCLVYSLLGLIYNHNILYTLFFNFILSLFLLISVYLRWWIFPWFLIFLVFHFFVSMLKMKKRTHGSA
ncbi:MAG: hypothetical protein WC415_02935 [Patescibacteria group bacterium]|jgi:hypothetical protein